MKKTSQTAPKELQAPIPVERSECDRSLIELLTKILLRTQLEARDSIREVGSSQPTELESFTAISSRNFKQLHFCNSTSDKSNLSSAFD